MYNLLNKPEFIKEFNQTLDRISCEEKDEPLLKNMLFIITINLMTISLKKSKQNNLSEDFFENNERVKKVKEIISKKVNSNYRNNYRDFIKWVSKKRIELNSEIYEKSNKKLIKYFSG
ncbi:MAG: hypothetical protein N4A44_03705 [Alphaproteobacteria bacterium]|jgi:hypothetical protein|nr:hypothetical protein [Alphaproteobacteria bacterium]